MNECLIYSILACCLFAMTAGPLGSFMVWRRLSFLADTLSHASLLGAILALGFDYPIFIGIIIIDISIVCFLIGGQKHTSEFIESKLAIFSQASLAGALILFNYIPSTSYQFSQFLFGDILALTKSDIVALLILMILTWLLIIINYRSWILPWVSEDIAMTHGINPHNKYVIILILLTLCISLSIKILGALLITAFMIIPALATRILTHTPLQMMVLSAVMGTLGSIIGLAGSLYFDLPASAAITVTLFCIYLTLNLKSPN